jgi:tetratricopeptide (TPR) repeat protein
MLRTLVAEEFSMSPISKMLFRLAVIAVTGIFSGSVLAAQDPLGALCNRAVRMGFVTGNVIEAEKACQAAILEGEKENPPGERAAYPMIKLAAMYSMMGMKEPERNAQALSLFQRALVLREAAHGPSHPLVGDTLSGMAAVLAGEGRYEEAEACYKRVVEIYEAHHGSESLELAGALSGYAGVLQALGREDEANEMNHRAQPIYDRAKQQRERATPSE